MGETKWLDQLAAIGDRLGLKVSITFRDKRPFEFIVSFQYLSKIVDNSRHGVYGDDKDVNIAAKKYLEQLSGVFEYSKVGEEPWKAYFLDRPTKK